MKPLLSRLNCLPIILSSGEDDFGNFRHVDKKVEQSNRIHCPSVPDTNHNDGNDGAPYRAVVDHTYRDHYRDPVTCLSYVSSENNENDHAGNKRKFISQTMSSPPRLARGGVTVAFPERLYDMLCNVTDEGSHDIISWQPHGRCFLIHKKDAFVEKIMPS